MVLAYVHGSMMQERPTVGDVDVAVLLRDDLTEDECLDRELGIEQALSDHVRDLPMDVRTLNHAPLPFRFAVIQHGHRIFSRSEDQRLDFEEGTMKLYQDFSYHRESYRREALGLES